MEREALLEEINTALNNRRSWENKQLDLYKARYNGLRRTNPPWPGASDINWPLADTAIEKIKPAYLQQCYATDLLATFQAAPGSEHSVAAGLATSAAQYFNYHAKECSNFETEIIYLIDYLLMLGRPSMKVLWDVESKHLVFEVIEPSRIIVPANTRCIDEADWIVHVLTFSKESYRLQPGYNQAIVDMIVGVGPSSGQQGESVTRTERYRREGITEGKPGEIVVWECWSRNAEGKWEVESIPPVMATATVKELTGNPFVHGLPPFADFPYELTQPQWYAPRGACEILLPWQVQLTKLLNSKNDALTLSNSPMFQGQQNNPNTVNLRWKPGSILPMGIAPVQMPSPPISYDVHINLMREVAEQRIGQPDFGLARQSDLRKARTLGELQMVQETNQESGDLRMRVFRMHLGKLYRLAWETLQQYSEGESFEMTLDEETRQVTGQAIRSKYRIKPSGSADGVTRAKLWQKAMARLQSFNGDPHINQGELRKSVLEADDAGLVKRLYQEPGFAQATQAEDQAAEIAIIRLGFPAVVGPADDHAVHIKVVLSYIKQNVETGQPPKPSELGMLQLHLADHVKALREQNPKLAKAAEDAIEVVGKQLSTIPQGTPAPDEASPQSSPEMAQAPAGATGY